MLHKTYKISIQGLLLAYLIIVKDNPQALQAAFNIFCVAPHKKESCLTCKYPPLKNSLMNMLTGIGAFPRNSICLSLATTLS